MRILVATHNYPRFPADPAGAFVRRIALAAAQAGHAVEVVAPHAPGLPRLEADGGVAVRRFRYAPDSLERAGYLGDLHRRALRSPLVALAVPPLLLGFRQAIRRAALRFRPDVVHAHWWLPAGWAATGLRGVPLVITCHGSDVRLLEGSNVLRHLGRRVLGRATAVTAVSAFLARDLERLVPSGRLPPRVLSMPVEVGLFEAGRAVPRMTPPRILYAGNLVRSKGVAVLLEAYGLLRARGVAAELKILGEGSAEADLRREAARIGAPDVSWSRFVPQDQMAMEYGSSTVVVLPTLGAAEGLGLVLVEALLAGTAVIGTTAGGIPEVIEDGVTGLLVPGGDVPALAAALERMLTDPELRARTVLEGTRRAARFAPENAAGAFLSLFDELVGRHAH
jgi:glycosyltransferase involved in cell wall biosynthesis